MTLSKLLVNKTSCHCCQTMKYLGIYDTLSLKQCIGVGDGRRDSDDENDASNSNNTDTVAGTFKQTLKATMEHGILALCIYMYTQHGYSFCCRFASDFLLIQKRIAYNHSRPYYVSSQMREVVMHQNVCGC